MEKSELAESTDWYRRAACVGAQHFFFPEFNERPNKKMVREEKARAICNACPVINVCLGAALENHEYGYWAGTNEEDRYLQFGVKPSDGSIDTRL